MARFDQLLDVGGYCPVEVDTSQLFADSLRFHAALDVRTVDHRSAYTMWALTMARKYGKRLSPKDRMKLIAKIIAE